MKDGRYRATTGQIDAARSIRLLSSSGYFASSQQEENEAEARSKNERKLRFAFRFQRWDEVLQWYAEQAELSLVLDGGVPGTFNYTDNKAYTVTEAMDLLNGVLLTKGYVLLRRGRMLMVAYIAEGIPPDLVPRVTLEELGKRGRFELVSVTFSLGRQDAETVRSEIHPLLGVCGSAVVQPQKHQMQVIARAGVMRAIGAIIDSIPAPDNARKEIDN